MSAFTSLSLKTRVNQEEEIALLATNQSTGCLRATLFRVFNTPIKWNTIAAPLEVIKREKLYHTYVYYVTRRISLNTTGSSLLLAVTAALPRRCPKYVEVAPPTICFAGAGVFRNHVSTYVCMVCMKIARTIKKKQGDPRMEFDG